MALKRCVTVRDAAVEGRGAPRRRWRRCARRETVTPRATSSSISSNAPRQLGRQRHLGHGRGVEQPAQQRAGRARERSAGRARRPGAARGTGPRRARRGRAAPMPSAGIARSASSSAASGAVTNVGWNAVVPVASSASPTRTYPSWSVAMRSTPAKPLTCRSTNPGAAIPLPAPDSPTARDRPAVDLDVAGDERRRRPAPLSTPSLIPSPPRPCARVIRCLRASTKTIATGSV